MNDMNENKVDVNYYTVTVESEGENEYHELINNSKAVILEAEVGKPAWFCYLTDDPNLPWHRVKTSEVVDIQRTLYCDIIPSYSIHVIEIYTANSKYTFKKG